MRGATPRRNSFSEIAMKPISANTPIGQMTPISAPL